MLTLAGLGVGALLVASLPYWLPAAVVALRMRLFTRINGEEGITVPGELVDATRFKQVYSHPAADGRSRGAALSDLFWYWLSPGPEIHQEHIEPGARYEEVARATRRILALPHRAAEELTQRCLTRAVQEWDIRRARLVRLRDLMMPVWAEFYYELVFGEPCPPAARALIVDNANDVVTALKCCGLRHMEKRHRLTRFLIGKVEAGEVPHALPGILLADEQALYLQGVFFNTAVVQTSEAMAHLLMLVAQHEEVQRRLATVPEDDHYLDRVIVEALRFHPLFGISHRITSADIAVDERITIPKGSVLCFNHPEFHRQGFDQPERFDPDRWETVSPRDSNYVPFGVAANRACPAQGLAPVTMRVAARELMRRFTLYSSASHTRSIPNRGPCLLEPKPNPSDPRLRRMLLAFMRFRDRWEDVWRSLVQLVLGTYMVRDARRQRLCQRYFEGQRSDRGIAEKSIQAGGCPVKTAERTGGVSGGLGAIGRS